MQATETGETTDNSTPTQASDKTLSPYRLIIVFAIINLMAVAGEWTMRIYFNIYLDRALSAPITIMVQYQPVRS